MREWICAGIIEAPSAVSQAASRVTAKVVAFVVLCLPLLWLGWQMLAEVRMPGSALGADPGEAVVLHLGQWTLRMLLLTLCVSSFRRLFGWTWLARFRRMVGLFAFSYLCLHILGYAALLAGFDWRSVIDDLTKRPYVTVGMGAFALLMPLAVTSTRGWQRRLGKRWQRLHRLIYPAAMLGLVHLAWLTKDGFAEVALYLVVLVLLLGERIWVKTAAMT